ncbi:uncharacterized protein LOC119611388 [Lucilia sericata]|uniref:uncharacterized protein LOC119611388 n=1 Tax=Lucilia sericata TaxID=13632 RepID=UPI0018A825C5|nr:uncharacterized protein LOC119611388 [Lucilia sericata]
MSSDKSRIIFTIVLLSLLNKANYSKVVKADLMQDFKPLYEQYNSECLAIVWLNVKQINNTFQLLERLLWRRHFKDILLIYEREYTEKLLDFNSQLLQIFQNCWSKGFISVLLWSQQHLYTYHPYPHIKVRQLSNVGQFWDKTHLNNFHQRPCLLPFFQFPNQCYSYRNRQGQLIRTGYFYKWLQLYLQYYNATIEHYSIDVWSSNVSQKESLEALTEMGFCLIPIYLLKFKDYFDTSNVMHLSKVTLMVPNAREITSSLYLILPLMHYIGLIIMASTIMLFVLMYYMEYTTTKVKDLKYTADVNFMLEINIPQSIKQRIHTGNNAELYTNRQKLNMTYMYTVHDEFMDYLLFQQYYLKHPIARKLDEALFYRPLYVTVPHRSPLIDHLNKYLMRIFESGLVQKFLMDTKWDGVLSGNIKLMFDIELEKPLSLKYLYYGFAVWICGLLCALITFVIEYEIFAFKDGRRPWKWINRVNEFMFKL